MPGIEVELFLMETWNEGLRKLQINSEFQFQPHSVKYLDQTRYVSSVILDIFKFAKHINCI